MSNCIECNREIEPFQKWCIWCLARMNTIYGSVILKIHGGRFFEVNHEEFTLPPILW